MPAQAVATPERRGAADHIPESSRQRGRLGERRRSVARPGARADLLKLMELRLPLDAPACGMAREAMTVCLRGHMTGSALDIARLLISELASNAVRHSGATVDEHVVVRVWLGADEVRLEVDDPGGGGAVGVRAPNPHAAGGFGLDLVETLSTRWAVERVPGGRTRVWAEVARAAGSLTGSSRAKADEELVLQAPRNPRRAIERTENHMIPETNHTSGAPTLPDGPRSEREHRQEQSDSSHGLRKRGKANLERAHKTVDGIAEAAPGSPRSGSA